MGMPEIRTEADFKVFTKDLQSQPEFRSPLGWGIFRAQVSQKDKSKMLTGIYPSLSWKGQNLGSFALYAYAAGLLTEGNAELWDQPELVLDITPEMVDTLLEGFAPYLKDARGRSHANAQVAKYLQEIEGSELPLFKLVILFDDEPVKSLAAAYLKLSALSKRFVKPREINLDGIFGILPNVAWCDGVALDLDWLRDNEVTYKMIGRLPNIDYVDKLPRYLAHIVPDDDLRIISSHSVSLGAQLEEGAAIGEVTSLPGIFCRGKWLPPLPATNIQ